MAALSMTKLDKYMRNQGKGNFDFEALKQCTMQILNTSTSN